MHCIQRVFPCSSTFCAMSSVYGGGVALNLDTHLLKYRRGEITQKHHEREEASWKRNKASCEEKLVFVDYMNESCAFNFCPIKAQPEMGRIWPMIVPSVGGGGKGSPLNRKRCLIYQTFWCKQPYRRYGCKINCLDRTERKYKRVLLRELFEVIK